MKMTGNSVLYTEQIIMHIVCIYVNIDFCLNCAVKAAVMLYYVCT